MTTSPLPIPLVLDAHQLTLIEEWQAQVETGDGPTLHTAAFRRGRHIGSLVLPLAELHGPRLATALAFIGRWAAVLATDALLVVWHDAQLHGALEDNCPWPGRLCALRVERFTTSCDYYPAVIEHAAPLPSASWTVDGSIRDPNPTLPIPMLDLIAGMRGRRPGPLSQRRIRRTAQPWSPDRHAGRD